MPHHIYGLDEHTEQQYEYHEAVADLVVSLYLLVCEEQRYENECEHAAVYLGTSVHTCALVNVYRVILVRHETGYQLNGVEHCPETVIGNREIELTESKCIVNGEYHYCTAQHRYKSSNAHSYEYSEVFAESLEFPLCSEEYIIKEVQSDENGYHKANIEVCDEHYRCGDNEVQLASVVHQIFNAEDYQRQEYGTVDPHGVDELDNDICHHCVHR